MQRGPLPQALLDRLVNIADCECCHSRTSGGFAIIDSNVFINGHTFRKSQGYIGMYAEKVRDGAGWNKLSIVFAIGSSASPHCVAIFFVAIV
jgi:hypothetical protein